MIELPAELVLDGSWPAGGQAGRFGCIRGGAQCVRAHVADGYGLTGGSGSGSCRRSLHITGIDPTHESTADLLGSVQLSPGERPGPGDGSARAVILWSFGLEQHQNPLCAIGGPCGDKTSIGFAERLRRSHYADSTEMI
nr:hypothetical protein [Candidatus Frankia nodulisporulans]